MTEHFGAGLVDFGNAVEVVYSEVTHRGFVIEVGVSMTGGLEIGVISKELFGLEVLEACGVRFVAVLKCGNEFVFGHVPVRIGPTSGRGVGRWDGLHDGRKGGVTKVLMGLPYWSGERKDGFAPCYSPAELGAIQGVCPKLGDAMRILVWLAGGARWGLREEVMKKGWLADVWGRMRNWRRCPISL